MFIKCLCNEIFYHLIKKKVKIASSSGSWLAKKSKYECTNIGE